MNNVSIIEFPSNLGLKEPSPGHEPGVKKMPDWLRKQGFHNSIAPESIRTLTPPPYTPLIDPGSSVLNANSIVHYAKEQAVLMNEVLFENKFPLVLGGDCSILLGPAIALKQKGNYALFYLDGHTDFMEPSMSSTGGVGGMAAAMAAGFGPGKLTNINGLKPYIREEYVWCVGNREYDDDYENVVRNSSAKYVSLSSLREAGIANCVNAFLEMVDVQKLDGFWLHIDVDVLDDNLMPAVDSRTPGGLTYDEFNDIVQLLLSNTVATGVEITILDPELDPTGKYTKEFVRHFVYSFNATRKNL